MKTTQINVLGTEYDVQLCAREEVQDFPESNDGECHIFAKIIYIVSDDDDRDTAEEKLEQEKEVAIHELFHAFVQESGLSLENGEEERIAFWLQKIWRKYCDAVNEVFEELL